MIHTRHGSAVKLRHIKWFVEDRSVSKFLLRRSLQDGLGPTTCDKLATAADCFRETVDTERLLEVVDQYGASRLPREMEGVFHADGGEREGKDDENTDMCCDIWEDSDAE